MKYHSQSSSINNIVQNTDFNNQQIKSAEIQDEQKYNADSKDNRIPIVFNAAFHKHYQHGTLDLLLS